MIDTDGPSPPADRDGNKYVLAYICCLRHGVLLEPCRGLKHSEARRAFAKCLFRARTLPVMVRSDHG
eukprot:6807484-Alexandrium_andersonii.AAC.1